MTCIWHNRIALLDMVFVSFSLQFCGAQTLPWVCYFYLSRSHHCSQSRGMYVLLMYTVCHLLPFSIIIFFLFLSFHSILFFFSFHYFVWSSYNSSFHAWWSAMITVVHLLFYCIIRTPSVSCLFIFTFLHGKPFIFCLSKPIWM